MIMGPRSDLNKMYASLASGYFYSDRLAVHVCEKSS